MPHISAGRRAGIRLRQLRTTLGIPQEAVAASMTAAGHSWHQTTVAKTEAATRPLGLDEAVALAAVFCMPLSQFLELGASPRADQLSQAQADVETISLQMTRLAARLKEAVTELRTTRSVNGA